MNLRATPRQRWARRHPTGTTLSFPWYRVERSHASAEQSGGEERDAYYQVYLHCTPGTRATRSDPAEGPEIEIFRVTRLAGENGAEVDEEDPKILCDAEVDQLEQMALEKMQDEDDRGDDYEPEDR